MARKAAKIALMSQHAKSLTFDEVANRVLSNKLHEFRNKKHAAQWRTTLKTYVSPSIGKFSLADVALNQIVGILEPLVETAATSGITRPSLASEIAHKL